MTGRLTHGALVMLGVSLFAFGCGDSGRSGSDHASVEIIDNAFSPSLVRVAKGTTVTWTWKGANTHSVAGTFDGEFYSSGDHTGAEGFTASHQFTTTGTYQYVCGFHGGGMSGTVIVG